MNYKKLLYNIFRIIIIFAFPPILISIVFIASYFTTRIDIKTPIILITFNDKIKISEYISMYIAILGIEITAILTWVIHRFSISKENQEKSEKTRLSRSKVYTDLISSLEYLFELYLKSLFFKSNLINKSILLSDNWEENLFNLDIDSKYIEIYRGLYNNIITINRLIEEEKSIYCNLDDLFKKISLDSYYIYKKQLGSDIKIKDIIRFEYVQAMDKLVHNDAINKSKVQYANGKLMYSVEDKIYTLYSVSGQKLCECTFLNGKPYSGYVQIYNRDKLHYQGKIEEGVPTEGTFFDCKLNENDEIVFDNSKKPIQITNFMDMKNAEKNRLLSSEDCKIANVKYIHNQYVIDKNTIKVGKNIGF